MNPIVEAICTQLKKEIIEIPTVASIFYYPGQNYGPPHHPPFLSSTYGRADETVNLKLLFSENTGRLAIAFPKDFHFTLFGNFVSIQVEIPFKMDQITNTLNNGTIYAQPTYYNENKSWSFLLPGVEEDYGLVFHLNLYPRGFTLTTGNIPFNFIKPYPYYLNKDQIVVYL